MENYNFQLLAKQDFMWIIENNFTNFNKDYYSIKNVN